MGEVEGAIIMCVCVRFMHDDPSSRLLAFSLLLFSLAIHNGPSSLPGVCLCGSVGPLSEAPGTGAPLL